MEILLAFVGMGIGALSGFFGIGGGTVLVPVLLLMGYGMKTAVGISVMQMVFSSLYGSFLNWRRGTLVLGEGLFVGFGGFMGGYLSGYLTSFVSGRFLQFVFIGFVLFALLRMITSKVHEDAGESKTLQKWLLFIIGMGIGVIAISIGVGGAIILIPLLSGLLHYPVKKAVSAGLFFVVFSSVAGMLGRLVHGEIDLLHGTIIGVGSLLGVYLGVWLKEHVSNKSHKNFIVIMYAFILAIMVYKMFFAQ
ncbi:sulfite exporter TauE/SafE family protein [Nitratifractor sp.]|uniref:sulfite exporter TauE/SafE family protein n=1 Tax=Nitratifractor sp. TaxID=2268144 RepID=UPI0025DD161D|nr:sulfite exporter TauE/SafE family protein [Nitratifractor sp.]